MNEILLSECLKYWRAERPDEWTMDEFIRKATKLENASTDSEEIERLKAELSEAVEIISESCSSLHGAEFAKHYRRKHNFLSKHEKQS